MYKRQELNYAFVNYNVLAENSGSRRIALRTERFEIPVQLGFQFGVLRLFGGALFRVTESERSSVPQLLKVRFNNGDVGVMGGGRAGEDERGEEGEDQVFHKTLMLRTGSHQG